MHVVRQVIDVEQPGTIRARAAITEPFELGVVHRGAVGVFIYEIDQAAADAFNGRHLQGQRAMRAGAGGLGAVRDGVGKRVLGIDNAERHGGHGRAVRRGEAGGVAVRRLADQVVYVALAIQRGLALAVLGHGGEAHALEQGVQLLRLRMGEFHELEAVRAGRVVLADFGARCVMRKRAHGVVLP